MRTFRDSSGTDWTVFEVRRVLSVKKGDRGERSVLAKNFASGWLCFENASAKRRLVQFPERWREMSEVELGQLLSRAQPAPRATFPLGDDLGDFSPSADVRSE
jgi:hypothetical protein